MLLIVFPSIGLLCVYITLPSSSVKDSGDEI